MGVSRIAVVVAVVLLTVSAGAAQPLVPLIAEWDRYFTVRTGTAGRDGRSTGGATVWNTSDWGAQRIQLLVESLDGSGQTVAQRVVWLGSDLPPGAHAYVAAPMPASASYRVRVFAFNLDTSAGPR
jgi:hypothetical protein